jgi:hypothetical protein
MSLLITSRGVEVSTDVYVYTFFITYSLRCGGEPEEYFIKRSETSWNRFASLIKSDLNKLSQTEPEVGQIIADWLISLNDCRHSTHSGTRIARVRLALDQHGKETLFKVIMDVLTLFFTEFEIKQIKRLGEPAEKSYKLIQPRHSFQLPLKTFVKEPPFLAEVTDAGLVLVQDEPTTA